MPEHLKAKLLANDPSVTGMTTRKAIVPAQGRWTKRRRLIAGGLQDADRAGDVGAGARYRLASGAAVPVAIEIGGLLVSTVTEVTLPKDSVLRACPTFTGKPDSEQAASLVRVELPPGGPELERWKEWYKDPRAGYATARIVDGAKTLWVDVVPARDPGAPFEWLQVVQATVPAFTRRLRVGKTVTLAALTAARKEVADRAAAATKAGTPVDASDATFLAAHDALHARLNNVEAGCPHEPDAVYEWWVVDGHGVASRAKELCDLWEAYLAAGANPLQQPVRDEILEAVNAARMHLGNAKVDPKLPLSWPLAVASRLVTVSLSFRQAVRRAEQVAQGAYSSPDFTVTARQLLGELEAFAMAARRAATHETVFGSLVENRVRELVARCVSPLTVSSGALAGVPYKHQLDAIVWDHQLLPAVVEQGDVAVVAPMSVAGLLEIKASANLGEFAHRIESLRDDVSALRTGSQVEDVAVPSLGLVILDEQPYADVREGSHGALTVLFRKVGSFDYEPNMDGILDLMRFLYEAVLPTSRAMRRVVEQREVMRR